MSILDWLFDRTQGETVDDAGAPPPGEAVEVEEVFAVVDDATDDDRPPVRRGITLRGLAPGREGPALIVLWHDSMSLGTLDCGNVAAVELAEGHPLGCIEFLTEVMAVEPGSLGPGALPRLVAGELRAAVRPALSVLVAAGRSDREFPLAERGPVAAYLAEEMRELAGPGHGGAEAAARDALARIVPHMMPSGDLLTEHLAAVAHLPAERFSRFVAALGAVVHADGELTISEEDFLEEIAHLVGAQG